jgi:hypothetical protein
MNKIKNSLLFIGLVFTLSSVVSILPVYQETAYAVDCSDGFYDSNDIVFYRPDGCDSVCVGNNLGSISGSSSLPPETVEYLDSLDVKEKIDENKAVYEFAEEETGIPWEALAVIHFREAELNPEKSIVNGNDLGDGENEYSGQDISEDPNQDAVMAAQTFKEMSLSVYQLGADGLDEKSPAEAWGKAFLAYDVGRIYSEEGRDYTQSPYVVNGLDNSLLNMSWDLDSDGRSGVDDLDAGALTVLSYIDGVRSSMGCSDGGVVAGDIVETGINLALGQPATEGQVKVSDAAPSFITAFKGLNNGRVPSENNPCETADCGIFVSVVMRSSRVDPDFPVSGTDIQLAYMQNSERYSEVTNGDIKPGDILLYNVGTRGADYAGHSMIYTNTSGPYRAVDSSLCERVPSVRPNSSVEWMKSRPNYSAWRVNG